MFVYYNIIWILCLLLLFASIYSLMRKKRARQAALSNGQYGNNNPNFVVVDMDGRHTQQQHPYPATYAPPPPPSSSQATYRPPESNVEPPPPSYQDYNKDHRVNQPPPPL